MLQVQNVTVEVGGKNVVQGATFTVMARDKVGIVGRNGAGKWPPSLFYGEIEHLVARQKTL